MEIVLFTRTQSDPPSVHASMNEVMQRMVEKSNDSCMAWDFKLGAGHGVIAYGFISVSTKGISPLPTEELVFQYCRTAERFRYVKSVSIVNDEINVVIESPSPPD